MRGDSEDPQVKALVDRIYHSFSGGVVILLLGAWWWTECFDYAALAFCWALGMCIGEWIRL